MRGPTKFGSAWYYDAHFGTTVFVTSLEDVKGIDALVLWGGADISPSLYGEPSVYAEAQNALSQRDAHEVQVVNEAVRLGIPIIGVCRGAQLLCALAGGKLWQHVDNHAGKAHEIKYKGQVGFTNSYHHQMMRPPEDAVVLAATLTPLSPQKYSTDLNGHTDDSPEPELVHFPSLNAVGVQGHPEWLKYDHYLNVVMKDVIKDKLNIEVGY